MDVIVVVARNVRRYLVFLQTASAAAAAFVLLFRQFVVCRFILSSFRKSLVLTQYPLEAFNRSPAPFQLPGGNLRHSRRRRRFHISFPHSLISSTFSDIDNARL